MKDELIRSPEHRRFVVEQPCIISGAKLGVQAHHLMRAGGIKGVGLKSSDIWCVPLHHTIHSALHSNGNEELFFLHHGLDYETVKEIARELCLDSPCQLVKPKEDI